MKRQFLSVLMILVVSIIPLFAAGQQEKGEVVKPVKVLLNAHPWQEAVDEKIQEFTKATGIPVEVTVLGEDVYWDRVTLGLSSDLPPFDVFMMSPNQTGFIGYQNGWIASLDEYVNKEAAYDFKDVYPFIVDGFRYPDISGKIYGIPLTMEVYMLFYRKDLMEANKVDVSKLKTIDDWLAMLEKIEPALKKDGISAAVIRGQDPTMPDELLAAVNTYWGDRPFIAQRMFYFDENWNPRFTDPAVVKGFETWAKLLSMGPVGSEAYTWYDCSTQFANGNAATYWFDASLFASIFEDPNQSSVVGKVGYLPIPKSSTGDGTTHWAWGLSVAERSQNKDSAWEFVKWATSKEIDKFTAPSTYGPIRETTWNEMKSVFGSEYASAVDKSLKKSVPGYMYFNGAREVADRIIDAVIAMSKGADSAVIMSTLNKQALEIVTQNGLKK